MAVRWHRIEAGHYQSNCGQYTIILEKPRPYCPHPWIVYGPQFKAEYEYLEAAKHGVNEELRKQEERERIHLGLPESLQSIQQTIVPSPNSAYMREFSEEAQLRKATEMAEDLERRQQEFLRMKGLLPPKQSKPKKPGKIKGWNGYRGTK